MEKMKEGVKRCTYLQIPNAHNPTRDILAFSGLINDDNDFYFNDSLFPRIDEDFWRDWNDDGDQGIDGYDDDGDGAIDEILGDYDDDEDGFDNEEILDGLDDDGDGNIDEDLWADLNMDWASGVIDMDDDGDGAIDEGHENDDDEDGQLYEDPLNEVIYSYDNATNTLTESIPYTGESKNLSTHVTLFQVTYEAPDSTHGPRIQISLTITDEDGASIPFSEYVYMENTLQRIGKRVR
jgi:hypothetical protein